MSIITKRTVDLHTMAKIEAMEAILQEQQEIINAIAEKVGYTVEKVGETESGSEIYTYEKDESYESPDGDFQNPIPYVEGMEVEEKLFYYIEDGEYDKDLPFECIKSGKPENFFDGEYFEVMLIPPKVIDRT